MEHLAIWCARKPLGGLYTNWYCPPLIKHIWSEACNKAELNVWARYRNFEKTWEFISGATFSSFILPYSIVCFGILIFKSQQAFTCLKSIIETLEKV